MLKKKIMKLVVDHSQLLLLNSLCVVCALILGMMW